jgi:hypothetical protein
MPAVPGLALHPAIETLAVAVMGIAAIRFVPSGGHGEPPEYAGRACGWWIPETDVT